MGGNVDKRDLGGDISPKSQEVKECLIHNDEQTQCRNDDMDTIAGITKKLTKRVLKHYEEKYKSHLAADNSYSNINPFSTTSQVYSNSAKVYTESAKEIYRHRYTILGYALFFVPGISIGKGTLQITAKILSKTKVGTEILIKAKNGYNYVAKLGDNSKIYFKKLGKNINRKFYKTIVEKVPIIRRIGMLKGVKIGKFNVKKVNNAGGDTFTYKLCDSTGKLISTGKTNFITFNNAGGKITFSGMNASGPATGMGGIFFKKILDQFKGQTILTTRQIKPSVNLMLERMGFLPIITKKGQKLDKILFNRTSIFVPYGARKGLLQDLLNKEHLTRYTITQLKKGNIVRGNVHSTFYNVRYQKVIK